MRTLITVTAALVALAGCGNQTDDQEALDAKGTATATAKDPCPMPGWWRNPYEVAGSEWAKTPQAAVLAVGGQETEITRTVRPARGKMTVDVVRGGQEGSFDVERINGRWVVVAGNGCGTADLGSGPDFERCQALLDESKTDEWTECVTNSEAMNSKVTQD